MPLQSVQFHVDSDFDSHFTRMLSQPCVKTYSSRASKHAWKGGVPVLTHNNNKIAFTPGMGTQLWKWWGSSDSNSKLVSFGRQILANFPDRIQIWTYFRQKYENFDEMLSKKGRHLVRDCWKLVVNYQKGVIGWDWVKERRSMGESKLEKGGHCGHASPSPIFSEAPRALTSLSTWNGTDCSTHIFFHRSETQHCSSETYRDD